MNLKGKQMKNILRENMRRFGTKNLNEAPESEYNPFVAMDDIVVNVMATRSGTMSTSISSDGDPGVAGNQVLARTTPGEYNVDNDIIKVIISGKDQQIFKCSGAVIQGKKSNGTVDWNNINRGCEIKLILKDIIDDYIVRLPGEKSKIQLIIKSNAEEDPFYLDINLGKSRFKRKRTPSMTMDPVTSQFISEPR